MIFENKAPKQDKHYAWRDGKPKKLLGRYKNEQKQKGNKTGNKTGKDFY